MNHETTGENISATESQGAGAIFGDRLSARLRNGRTNQQVGPGRPIRHGQVETCPSSTIGPQVYPASNLRSVRTSKGRHMRVPPLESVIPASIDSVITLQGAARHLHAAR